LKTVAYNAPGRLYGNHDRAPVGIYRAPTDREDVAGAPSGIVPFWQPEQLIPAAVSQLFHRHRYRTQVPKHVGRSKPVRTRVVMVGFCVSKLSGFSTLLQSTSRYGSDRFLPWAASRSSQLS